MLTLTAATNNKQITGTPEGLQPAGVPLLRGVHLHRGLRSDEPLLRSGLFPVHAHQAVQTDQRRPTHGRPEALEAHRLLHRAHQVPAAAGKRSMQHSLRRISSRVHRRRSLPVWEMVWAGGVWARRVVSSRA